jgi:hypothetical protein
MRFPTLFGIFIVFILWFAYQRRKDAHKTESAKEDFWETESKSNSVRKQSLDFLNYIDLSEADLPFSESKDFVINDCQNTLYSLMEKKIVNLTGITNTDLKLQYGSSNLRVLSEYDENFTILVRTLISWGKRLCEMNQEEDARKVLEYAVQINTDVSDTYRQLSSLYKNTNDTEKIEYLICTAEALNSINKKVILDYLGSIK